VRGVPVAVQVQRSRGLENAVNLHEALAHPLDVYMDAALPSVSNDRTSASSPQMTSYCRFEKNGGSR
jgi:hypothetical protein